MTKVLPATCGAQITILIGKSCVFSQYGLSNTQPQLEFNNMFKCQSVCVLLHWNVSKPPPATWSSDNIWFLTEEYDQTATSHSAAQKLTIMSKSVDFSHRSTTKSLSPTAGAYKAVRVSKNPNLSHRNSTRVLPARVAAQIITLITRSVDSQKWQYDQSTASNNWRSDTNSYK